MANKSIIVDWPGHLGKLSKVVKQQSEDQKMLVCNRCQTQEDTCPTKPWQEPCLPRYSVGQFFASKQRLKIHVWCKFGVHDENKELKSNARRMWSWLTTSPPGK